MLHAKVQCYQTSGCEEVFFLPDLGIPDILVMCHGPITTLPTSHGGN